MTADSLINESAVTARSRRQNSLVHAKSTRAPARAPAMRGPATGAPSVDARQRARRDAPHFAVGVVAQPLEAALGVLPNRGRIGARLYGVQQYLPQARVEAS